MEKPLEQQMTKKVVVARSNGAVVKSSRPEEVAMGEFSGAVQPPATAPRHPRQVSRSAKKSGSKQDMMSDPLLRERWRQLSLSLFFRERAPLRSLGFTSTLGGEGKTFLASILATALADDSAEPVALVECNWEHPSLHEYYGVPAMPGLAEWLRGECNGAAIRHQVGYHLTVIPAGEADQEAVRLLRQLQQKRLLQMLAAPNEFLVVDLPPIMTTGYGRLAAALVDGLLLVVRAGVTPDHLLAEACAQLEGLPVEGIVLNQMRSRIPRWIRALL